MKIKTNFKFGDHVRHILGEKELVVVSIQINTDHSVVYGCANETGNWEWYKAYELQLFSEPKTLGFEISLE